MDMIGSKSGMLTIISHSHKTIKANYWNCSCDCGGLKKISTGEFNRGRTPVLSCGCYRPNRIVDLVGLRSGRLVVLNFHGQKKLKTYWICKCDCGNEKIIAGESLTRKKTLSCGCLVKVKALQRRKTIKERFIKRIQIIENNCWIWTGPKDKDGYGLCGVSYPDQRAHRTSFKIFKGEILSGMFICHTCDNSSCCNPDHLYMGTHSDNTRDAIERNRMDRGPCPSKALKGEKNPKAKLNERKVKNIRRLHSTWKMTHALIARKYNVSESSITKLLKRKSWNHI